jgi:TRAP-type transport system periplasmic protein
MRFRRIIVMSVAVLLLAACSRGIGEDKAGGTGEPVVLTMANGLVGVAAEPMLSHFASRVEARSAGALRVRIQSDWSGLGSGFEQRVITDVAAGKADLGWAATGVFDTMGVRDFQALTAPMLIDSYAAQTAVLSSDIARRMLSSLDALGVTGLAVIGDGLRKPIAAGHPMLSPSDWRGTTFGTLRSEGEYAAIQSLGAAPTDALGPALNGGIDAGTIQGYDKSLFIYHVNGVSPRAAYITANVNLWPQTIALFAGSTTFGRLSPTLRAWLRAAAADTATWSMASARTDPLVLPDLCQSGARFANASPSQMAQLREAFEPVYVELSAYGPTRSYIDRIETLKATVTPEAVLVIPPGCTNAVPKVGS